jgi:thiamine-phosphate pyrophosphorylase
VTRLLDGGATIIQLREKSDSADRFFADAEHAVRLGQAAGARMIINDRVDLALALGADGVHLGQDDMPVTAARTLLGPQAIIGFSTHNADQVDAALSLPIDYLAFGPVFPTLSKQNPDPVAGLDSLRRIRSMIAGIPVVAIGGIRKSSLTDVFAAGADCAAIISDILSPPQKIAQTLRTLLSASAK